MATSDPKIQQFLGWNKTFDKVPLSPPTMEDITSSRHEPGVRTGIAVKAAVLRNAGGHAKDALRSLVILGALANLDTVMIVHHEDCGMMFIADSKVKKMLEERRPDLRQEIDGMKFGEFSNVDESVRKDMEVVKAFPHLRKDTKVLGYSLDMTTGKLRKVK
ncbi:hypothetical protein BDY21DRAFT_14853 [Lineolata rhizophorae]|uniref:Carbonic anhydrase n=1 Tax=Lineolata rhizophorae TaxID=578093 RepID=A0A6A6PEQ0_9PEZI|nr:hypothetical protein BDY21DRAFT_14853 [Lineolata rhizophorae]